MSHISEEQKEALRVTIQSAVQESIDRAVDNVGIDDEPVEEGKSHKDKKESYKGDKKKESDDRGTEDEGEDVTEDDGDEDKDEEEEDEDDPDRVSESDIFESMDVVAVVSGSGGNKTETFTVTRMTELQRKARTGKYEYLTVTTRSGKEKEYSVSNGKMVEM